MMPVSADGEPLAAVVREAGEIAPRDSATPFKRWMKDRTDSPVTEADIAVNNFLHERLLALAA